MSAVQSVVIVGAGQAGACAARSLRERGFAGSITLVGDEVHLPYERPPLSKQALQEDAKPDLGCLHPAQYYVDQNIDHIAGVAVTRLDLAQRSVVLADGRRLPYDACLLATGGRARSVALLSETLPRVHVLRSLDDAGRLSARLGRGVRLAVVGGGFLGLEAAWSATCRGAQVTVLEAAPALLSRVLPAPASDWLAARAAALGVQVLRGTVIVGAVPPASEGAPLALVLADGTHLEADEVLVCVGLVPETGLATHAGLAVCETTGGILVDAECRTSDPHVWAAGDCVSQRENAQAGAVRRESWQNANTQASTAAAAILRAPLPAVPYPWFWTDQLDCNIQILGAPAPDLVYVVRGQPDPAESAPRAVWIGLRENVPVHGVAINAGTDLRILRPLFEAGVPVSAEALADASLALKPFVKSCLQRAA